MSGATHEGRTAQDLEWNAALADLRRRVAHIEAEAVQLGRALDRMQLPDQRKGEGDPRLTEGLSPRARADTVLGWFRYAIRGGLQVPVAQMLRYLDELESAIEDLVREQGTDHAR